MDISIFIAQILGAVFLIVSVSMFLRREMMRGIFFTLFSVRFFTYAFGLLLFVFGLSVILFHNVWSGDFYKIIITVLGWAAVTESLAYIFLPTSFFKEAGVFLRENSLFYALATIYLVLGAYLAYFGFLIN